jgi:hypothetical protein
MVGNAIQRTRKQGFRSGSIKRSASKRLFTQCHEGAADHRDDALFMVGLQWAAEGDGGYNRCWH